MDSDTFLSNSIKSIQRYIPRLYIITLNFVIEVLYNSDLKLGKIRNGEFEKERNVEAGKVEFIKLSPDKSSWEQGDSGESILRSKR